jgi:hypothetical protein
VIVEYPNDAPQDIAAQVDATTTAKVQLWLGFAHNDVDSHNRSLKHLNRRATQRSGTAAVLHGTQQDPDHRAPVLCRAAIARRELAIIQRRAA